MKSEENTVLTAKEANFKLINFFHGFYLATLNFFKYIINLLRFFININNT